MSLEQVIATSESEQREIIQNLRVERYSLQSTARNIYIGQGFKNQLDFPHDFHRTAKCTHLPVKNIIKVLKSPKFDKAFYAGLQVCGNVWTCPVCTAKIQEKRRLEISKAFDWAYSNNKKMIMVTFTIPHYHNQSLNELLTKQKEAFVKFRSGRAWTNIKKEMGFLGLIRSFEVTHGTNGWHPHTHEAWIVDKDVRTDHLRNKLAHRWFEMCSKSGLIADRRKTIDFLEYSIQISDNCTTSDYLAKNDDSKHWGADRELAKGSAKIDGKKTKHPFSLLVDYEKDNNNLAARNKWLEYSREMKGKRQIFWSPGLKKLTGVNEKTDLELAEEKEEKEKAELVKIISIDHWKLIRLHNYKTRILDVVENNNTYNARSEILRIIKELESFTTKEKIVSIRHAKNTEYFNPDTGELLSK